MFAKIYDFVAFNYSCFAVDQHYKKNSRITLSKDGQFGACTGGNSTTSSGEGRPHNHPASSSSSKHLPPYYTLAFIIKT